MPTDYFDEKVAERYDAASAEMFAPGAAEPVVAFLARLAGARTRHRHGANRFAPQRPTRRVDGVDLAHSRVARLREKPVAERTA